MRFIKNIHFSAMLLAAVCMSVGASRLSADLVISGQFESSSFTSATTMSGVEPDAANADSAFAGSNVWNAMQVPFNESGSLSFSNLLNSNGTNSGVNLSVSHTNGAYNTGSTLPDTYVYSYYSRQTFSFSGLPANQRFTLFLYAFNAGLSHNDRDAVFTIGSSSFDTLHGIPSSEDPSAAVTGMLTGATGATGTIDGTWAFGRQNNKDEIDWSGFQLAIDPGAAVPEPSSLSLLLLALVPVFLLARRRAAR